MAGLISYDFWMNLTKLVDLGLSELARIRRRDWEVRVAGGHFFTRRFFAGWLLGPELKWRCSVPFPRRLRGGIVFATKFTRTFTSTTGIRG